MARTFGGGRCAEINQITAYDIASTGLIVSTPAPAQGTYRFKVNTTTSNLIMSNGYFVGAPTLQYRWYCLRDFRVSGILNAGQDVPFFQWRNADGANVIRQLSWVRVTNSTWNIRYRNSLGTAYGTGTTALSTDTDYTIRIESNQTTHKVWVNGVLEIEVSDTANFFGWSVDDVILVPSTTASQDHYLGAAAFWQSASEADRPGTAITRYLLTPDGDSFSTEFGNDNTACFDGAGDYTYWDDWTGGGTSDGADGTTDNIGNVCCGGNAGREISTLTTATIANVANAGVVVITRSASAAGSKTVEFYHRLEQGGNNVEGLKIGIGTNTAWVALSTPHNAPPGGGAWTQTIIDGLAAGVRSLSTNGANDNHTAMAVEVFSVDDDPPATRRRVGATLGNPGVL